MKKIYSKWAERHTNRLNFLLHLIGIPMTIAALPMVIFYSVTAAVILFVTGYALQFIGHAIEGNKSGEQLLFERLLRRR